MDSFDREGVAQHRKVGAGPLSKRPATSFKDRCAGSEARWDPFRAKIRRIRRRSSAMHTEISRYHATASREVNARLALQRASIMHLVDLKRGGYSPCRTELRIGRLTDRPDRPISRRCKPFAERTADSISTCT